jgi:glycosyltransferase involved in cell wall biosynthesis
MFASVSKEARVPGNNPGGGDGAVESVLPAIAQIAAEPATAIRSGANSPVLFISHYSGRNGAPLILLRLLQWLKVNTDINIQVLLRSPGELQGDFASVGSVSVVPRLPRIISAIVRRAFGERMVESIEDALLRHEVRRLRPALIYSNTITNTREMAALGPLKIPTLCHVHEMEYWIRHELGLEKAIATVPFIQRFISVGSAVSDFLVSGVGVHPDRIDTVYEFPSLPVPSPEKANGLRRTTRRELTIDDDTFLVGACGTVDWRKGADIFLGVAREIATTSPKRRFRFVWVGGPTNGRFFDQLQHDIMRSNLSDLVSFVGPCSSAEKYYAAMDAFLLTSREDPCPLVMLEAASFGCPIVCFEGSGGAAEFIAGDAGIAVPYPDIREMAIAVASLEHSAELRNRLGNAAKKRVILTHDADTQCTAIFAAMSRTQPLLISARP